MGENMSSIFWYQWHQWLCSIQIITEKRIDDQWFPMCKHFLVTLPVLTTYAYTQLLHRKNPSPLKASLASPVFFLFTMKKLQVRRPSIFVALIQFFDPFFYLNLPQPFRVWGAHSNTIESIFSILNNNPTFDLSRCWLI